MAARALYGINVLCVDVFVGQNESKNGPHGFFANRFQFIEKGNVSISLRFTQNEGVLSKTICLESIE